MCYVARLWLIFFFLQGDITPLQLSNLGLGSGAGVAKLLSDAGAITTASARGTQPNDEEVQSEEEEEEDSD